MDNTQAEKPMSKHQHYWLETGVPHALVWINRKWRFDCGVCGKQKYFTHQPVNPLVPPAWAVYEQEVRAGNAHMVMAPPLQIGQESQESEGERYARIVKGAKL